MKVTTLTEANVAALAKFREEWLAIGFDTTPIDKIAARSAIENAYRCAGMPIPQIFIWLDSPLRGAYGAAFLKQIFSAQVRAQVRDQVWAQVSAQVRAQVRDQVWAQVSAQVRAQVRDQVWAQVSAQVRAQVRDQVWAQVSAQVRAQVRDQVWAQVSAQVRAQVRDQVWAQVSRAAYGLHDAAWLAFYDYLCRETGLDCCEKLTGLMDTARTCGWWWPFRNAVIVTSKPQSIHRDENLRLHCEDGLAVVYPDGWGIHAWHGVRVPAHVVMAPESITIQQISAEQNAEVRRVMMERMGWERFCLEADMNVIHSDELVSKFPSLPVSDLVDVGQRLVTTYREGKETAELLEAKGLRDFEDRPLRFVRLTDPSTGRQYTIRVLHGHKRCYEAIGWTFGLTEKQYKTCVQQHS